MKVTNVQQPRSMQVARAVEGSPIPLVELSGGTYQEPLIVVLSGAPGTGKSNFIGTAPGLAVIPTEHKSRHPILKAAAALGRSVVMPETDLLRMGNPMLIAMLPAACVTAERIVGNYKDEEKARMAAQLMDAIKQEIRLDGPRMDCCATHYYRWYVNRVKSAAYRMYELPHVRTLAFDTFGQFVEDMLFANYGRTDRIIPLEKRSFNQEVRDFLNHLSGKNLILSHHLAEIWQDNKPTGKQKPANSFQKIGHYASVDVRMKKNKAEVIARGEATWTLQVLDSMANPGLCGLDLLQDDEINFQNLASYVYPESDPEEWI